MPAPRPHRRRPSRLAALLDSEPAFIESEDDSLASSEADVCRCGETRGKHQGEKESIEGRCRGFREAR